MGVCFALNHGMVPRVPNTVPHQGAFSKSSTQSSSPKGSAKQGAGSPRRILHGTNSSTITSGWVASKPKCGSHQLDEYVQKWDVQTTTFDKCKKSFLRGPNDWETRHRNREFTDQVQLSHIAKRLMIITRNPKPSFIFSFRIVVSKSPIVIQSVFHPSFMVKVAVFGSRFFLFSKPPHKIGKDLLSTIRSGHRSPFHLLHIEEGDLILAILACQTLTNGKMVHGTAQTWSIQVLPSGSSFQYDWTYLQFQYVGSYLQK